jgi:phosphoglycolate phosphatase
MFGELGVASGDVDRAEAEWNAQMARASAPARAGAREAIAGLTGDGAMVGVVSAASAASVVADAERLDLRGMLSPFETSTSNKLTALRGHRSLRRHAVYVGDTEYDIRCAIEAGYVPVGVTDGYAEVSRLRRAGADHVVTDLRELVTVVVHAAVGTNAS